jgi:hypothetical protein
MRLPMHEITRGVQVELALSGFRRFTWRLRIGLWLVRLAAWIMPVQAIVVDVGETATLTGGTNDGETDR